MAKFELKLPKMGESVAEATITSWLKDVGDTIEMDDPVLEIATDKVDSEVPSEVDGVLVERFFNVDDIVQVGQVLAVIETEGGEDDSSFSVDAVEDTKVDVVEDASEAVQEVEQTITKAKILVTQPLIRSRLRMRSFSHEDSILAVGFSLSKRPFRRRCRGVCKSVHVG